MNERKPQQLHCQNWKGISISARISRKSLRNPLLNNVWFKELIKTNWALKKSMVATMQTFLKSGWDSPFQIHFICYFCFVLLCCSEFFLFLTFAWYLFCIYFLFRSNMDAIFPGEQKKESPSKQLTEEKNDSKQENNERKSDFDIWQMKCLKNIVGWVKDRSCIKGNTKKLLSEFMEHFLLDISGRSTKGERTKRLKLQIPLRLWLPLCKHIIT